MRAAFLTTEGQAAGWIARIALHGHDVALAPGLDPVDVQASQMPGLYDRPLPAPGAQTVCATVQDVLRGADIVWTDTELDAGLTDPGTMVVGPNGGLGVNAITPVDLIPAVELFGPDAARALPLFRCLGCDPVITGGGVLPAMADALSDAARRAVLAGGSAEGVARLLGHGIAPLWALGGPHRAENPDQRDADLTAILRALKWQERSVGQHLLQADAEIAGLPEWDQLDLARPVPTLDQAVPADWADYNGHMTESRYLDAFGRATDRFMILIGCNRAYIAAGHSFFTAETHICHLAETRVGEEIRMETQLLSAPGRKMHLFHHLWSGDTLRATAEHILIHVSLETRRACTARSPLAERLTALAQAHTDLPRPTQAGRSIR